MKKASDTEAAMILLGNNGKELSNNKYEYAKSNPNNMFIFDADVYVDSGRIWCGDIDLTVEAERIKKLSKYIGKSLHILRKEDQGDIGKAVAEIRGDKIILKNAFKLVYGIVNGRPIALMPNASNWMENKESYTYNDVKMAFTLPDVSRLKIKDGFSVLEAFYTAVAKVLDEQEYEKLIVSSTYAADLMKRVLEFYEKSFPEADKKDIEEMAAWEWYKLGPKNFIKDPSWVDNKIGYVLK